MIRQLDKLRSLGKAGMRAPETRDKKPNPAFKAPDYNLRDLSTLSARQGGADHPAFAGLLILMVLTKVIRVRTKINKLCRLSGPVTPVKKMMFSIRVNKILTDCFLLKNYSLGTKYLDGVNTINNSALCKFILPPE